MTNQIYESEDFSITNATAGLDDSNGSYYFDWSSTEANLNATFNDT